MDSKATSLLVLLNLSATSTYGVIDHSILFHLLKHYVAIKGSALPWLRSYLTNGTQFVLCEVSKSKHTTEALFFPKGRSLVHCSLQSACFLLEILFTATELAFTVMWTTRKSMFLLDQTIPPRTTRLNLRLN